MKRQGFEVRSLSWSLHVFALLVALSAGLGARAASAAEPAVRVVGSLVFDGVPVLPPELAVRTAPYAQTRAAALLGWTPDGTGLLVSTRFGETAQVHVVTDAGGDRRQLTVYDEPVAGAGFDPLTWRA